MSDNQDINAIFDRIANRNATDRDIQTLRQSVVIGGNAQGATIVTGDDNILGNNNTVQIGKYNINIAEGSNIKVGDTIYQGADAETVRAMLLEVLTDKIVIDSTFSRLFGKSESSGVDWDWGMKLLKQKQLPEIRKRLTDTLGRDRILMDVSIEEQQNWVNRSPLAADRTLQINGKDCGTLDANKMLIEIFGRDDIEGKLLILGAPGAGKTTALLSLAEQLVEGAISQPRTVIPVLFELSTWQNDNQSIQDWLIDRLYDLHGGNRKSKLYEQWLERQVLLPLLDGLDELGLERQKKCTEKLNEFAEHYPQLVVCCRVKEFEAADIRLRGAVCLQSLSDSQIQHYLSSLNRPELWEAIQTTPSLQAMLEMTTEGDPGLLRVPLFVKLVADVYDRQQPISGKADLLDRYIDRQLSFDKRQIDRRKGLDDYSWAYQTVKLEPDWKKTRSNLSWLARNLQVNNQVEFLIEHLQPSWINYALWKHFYPPLYIFIFPLSGGLIFGLIFGMFANSLKIADVLSIGFCYAMIDFKIESDYEMSLEVKYEQNLVRDLQSFYDGDVFGSLLIKPVEAVQLSMSKAVWQEIFKNFKLNHYELYDWLTAGLVFGLASKLMGRMSMEFAIGLAIGLPVLGLVYLSIVALTSGLKQELKVRSRPNQGIWNSLQSQIWITTIIFTLVTSIGVAFSFLGAWVFALFISLRIGFSTGGGRACSQHLALRIILWKEGLPWNFARFLNYCVERRLLLRVGGSYRFLHRELLDHFAQLSK
jgi:Effector-associated domain 10/NACHT domain